MSWSDEVLKKGDAREKLAREVVRVVHEAVDEFWPDQILGDSEPDRLLVYTGIAMELLRSVNTSMISNQSRDMLLAMDKEQKGIQP